MAIKVYISRVNLSIAIVAMVTTIPSNDEITHEDRVNSMEPFCSVRGYNATTERDETLEINQTSVTYSAYDESRTNSDSVETDSRMKLTSRQRGNLLSSFFYLYGVSGIVGGRLAERFGMKKVFGTAVFVDGIVNFLTPVASKNSYAFIFVLRVVMGMFQGMCYPSIHTLTSNWIPPGELARFMAFVYSAYSVGVMFSLTMGGVVISELGWEAVFYISGTLSFAWLALSAIFLFDSPHEHPRISKEEKCYILKAKAAGSSVQKQRKVPWKRMLLSVPMWAINVVHAGCMFGLSFALTYLPIYLSTIIGVDIKSNGFLSSLPFLATLIGGNGVAWLSNYLRKKTNLRSKTWKIILTILGSGGPGTFFLLVGYSGCHTVLALSFFVIGMALNGASSSAYLCNHAEIVPSFAGTAFGITSLFGNLYGMLAPLIIGMLIPEQTLDEWITVYWVVFMSYIASGAFYCIFLSTELQSWDQETEGEITKNKEGTVLVNEDKV